MANWTPNDIKRQWQRAKAKGWIDFFVKSAKDYDFSVSLLMAVASRETNMQNIIGDHGHGYGIMQIDVGSFPDWCHSGLWQHIDAAILKGAQVLDTKRESIRLGQGKTLKVGGKTFKGKELNADQLLSVSVAAYNSGTWAYYNFSTGRDVDATTTGHDYSSDTFRRETVLKGLGT